MFNRETHKSRGFGFIIYENEDSVDRVCEIDNHVIHGKAVSKFNKFQNEFRVKCLSFELG